MKDKKEKKGKGKKDKKINRIDSKKDKPSLSTAEIVSQIINPPPPQVPEIIKETDDIESTSATDLKSIMTPKELGFINLYFTGEYTKLKAMKLAGYKAKQENYLYFLAKKILEKHETHSDDNRKLGRSMGAGEIKVFNTLLSLMKSKNEGTRLNATAQLAKVLGMGKDQVEGAQGITIIFEGAPGQTNQVAIAQPAQDTEPALPGSLPYAGKVLQITR